MRRLLPLLLASVSTTALAGAPAIPPPAPGIPLGPLNQVPQANNYLAYGQLTPLATAGIRNIATGLFLPNSISGSNTQIQTRSPLPIKAQAVPGATGAFDLVCYYVPGAAAETAPTAPCIYKGSLEYPTGIFQQLTCGGSTTCSVPAGGTVRTDFFVTNVPPPGALAWARLYMTNANRVILRSIGLNTAMGAATQVGTSLTDQTMGGTITNTGVASTAPTSNASFGLTPLAFVTTTFARSACVYGDSRTAGTGDTFEGQNMDIGQFGRSLGAFMPYINIGVGSDQGAQYNASHTQRLLLANDCTDDIWGYGINDFDTGGASAATVEGYAQSWLSSLPSGSRGWLGGVDPHTTSTDNWITTTNQTPAVTAGNTARISFNEWGRYTAKGLGFAGFFDIPSTGEAGYNSGFWSTLSNGVLGSAMVFSDQLGIHRNQQGYLKLQNSSVINARTMQ